MTYAAKKRPITLKDAMEMRYIRDNILALIALLAVLGFGVWQSQKNLEVPKVGFVDSQALMSAFKEAHRVEQALQEEDQNWRKDLKVLEDTLKVFMDTMTVKYDRGDIKARRLMQEELALRNQQINNFTQANQKKMQQHRATKMATVYSKINVYMKEFGAKNGYDLILGTVQGGSILFGIGTKCDVSQAVIDGLNERYP